MARGGIGYKVISARNGNVIPAREPIMSIIDLTQKY